MDCTDITLTFQDKAAATRGLELLRDMAKADYAARKGGILPEEPDKTRTLCELFFRYRSLIRAYDPDTDFPYNPLRFLELKGKEVILDRCADLQKMPLLLDGIRSNDFFLQLCEAQALDAPDTPFDARCFYEETVSNTTFTMTVSYQDRKFHMRSVYTLDEDEWDAEPHETETVYAVVDQRQDYLGIIRGL